MKEKGKVFLNYDGKDIILSVLPPTGNNGTIINLRDRYASPAVAQTVAGVLAKRLGLRKRGSGWMKVLK